MSVSYPSLYVTIFRQCPVSTFNSYIFHPVIRSFKIAFPLHGRHNVISCICCMVYVSDNFSATPSTNTHAAHRQHKYKPDDALRCEDQRCHWWKKNGFQAFLNNSQTFTYGRLFALCLLHYACDPATAITIQICICLSLTLNLHGWDLIHRAASG